MSSGNVVGQTLDEKYKIESELGRGGMGTVYLATHVGTERPVAVKVIAPQFMESAEFVERFRREARAAGRLRHPNVVDVTDFGFSKTTDGNVAYLVMEYLDGCTLGEILEEEKKLPLGWTIDILEQVCSAVHEAHEQGIIHRDLKPDNIWLEPNQRGGYTVKVLDFGIAKLEESQIITSGENVSLPTTPTQSINKNTVAGENQTQIIADNNNSTALLEANTFAQTANDQTISNKQTLLAENETLIQPSNEVDLESGTAILPASNDKTSPKNAETKLISQQFETDKSKLKNLSTAELTNVGAVLGTPLYMSPEQCRGEKLTKQSDIYSLGVIAYQLLSGATPFSGDYTEVMRSHKEDEPPNLEVKKAPKKVKKLINQAMAKNVGERPPTAQAFASELRAQSEGIGVLLRRALEIYSRYLPKFLGLTILLYIPFILVTFLAAGIHILYLSDKISYGTSQNLSGIAFFAIFFVSLFCGYLLWGTVTWIVAQVLAVPLRPVKLRPALTATLKKWKSLLWVGLISGVLSMIGYFLCLIPGLYLSVIWALAAPVVMMDDLRGRAALKRSQILVKRSLRTTLAAICIIIFLPALLGITVGIFSSATVEAGTIVYQERIKKQTENKDSDQAKIANAVTDSTEADSKEDIEKRRNTKVVVQNLMTTLLPLPFQLILLSFASIIIALLYFKTRQIGGEPTRDLLDRFEDTGEAKSNWQKRIRERIQQAGKLISKS